MDNPLVSSEGRRIELTKEEESKVEEKKKQLDLSDPNAVIRFGLDIQRKVSDFTDNVLSEVKSRDTGQAGKALTDLMKKGEIEEIGPEIRRGLADLDGRGEVAGGIVVVRFGENVLNVIERVKTKIRDISPGLPFGVEIVPIYDRSDLIRRAVSNVSETLIEVILTVVFIVLLFLWHVPSALIPVITIPVAVLVAFIPFRMLGITANIMSLGGIAIAMGELVDAAIVVVEQTHKKLEERGRAGGAVDQPRPPCPPCARRRRPRCLLRPPPAAPATSGVSEARRSSSAPGCARLL